MDLDAAAAVLERSGHFPADPARRSEERAALRRAFIEAVSATSESRLIDACLYAFGQYDEEFGLRAMAFLGYLVGSSDIRVIAEIHQKGSNNGAH